MLPRVRVSGLWQARHTSSIQVLPRYELASLLATTRSTSTSAGTTVDKHTGQEKKSKRMQIALLLALTLFTTFSTLVMQKSRQGALRPSAPAVMLLSEILKFSLCLLAGSWPKTPARHEANRSGQSPLTMQKALPLQTLMSESITTWSAFCFSSEGVCLVVPSILYAFQNMLQLYGVAHTTASTYQCLCQFKIVATAVLSVWLLQRHISRPKWACILSLTMGVVLLAMKGASNRVPVEASMATTMAHAAVEINDPFLLNPFQRYADQDRRMEVYAILQRTATYVRPDRLAVMSILFASLLGSYSGVFLESRMKRDVPKTLTSTKASSMTSFALQNATLAFYSMVLIMFMLVADSSSGTRDTGSFSGCLQHWTLLYIVVRAVGGLLVAAVLRYADSIAKNFAVCLALVTTGLFEMAFFGRLYTDVVSIGSVLILGSSTIFMSLL